MKMLHILTYLTSYAHLCVFFWQVESEDKFERIGGSSIGGGTFWGLGALLTKTKVSLIKFCSCCFISFYLLCCHLSTFQLPRVSYNTFIFLLCRDLMSYYSWPLRDSIRASICLSKTSMEDLTHVWGWLEI